MTRVKRDPEKASVARPPFLTYEGKGTQSKTARFSFANAAGQEEEQILTKADLTEAFVGLRNKIESMNACDGAITTAKQQLINYQAALLEMGINPEP